MKIEFTNMPEGASRLSFVAHYLLNVGRTWWLFHFKYPWVKYDGFVRVMKKTSFAKGFAVHLGNHVQFGDYCNVACPLTVGNYVLMAGRVCFVGRYDHTFNVPGQYIWNGARGKSVPTIIDDDVWIGHGVTVVGPVHIGAGSIIAAGSVVTRDVPPCEVWGGIPARKIRDRYTEEGKNEHLYFLKSQNNKQ